MSQRKKKGMPWWLLLLLGLAGLAATTDVKPDIEPDDDDDDDDKPPQRVPPKDDDDDKPPQRVPPKDDDDDKPKPPTRVPPNDDDDDDDKPKPPPRVPPGDDPELDDPKIFRDYPTPAAFYAVKNGDYELGVAKKYVQTCLFLAAKKHGFDDALANEWATNLNTAAMRYRAVEFFTCCEDNDKRLGTYRYQPCNGQHNGCTHPGTNARGIRFLKTGGDTPERARAGLPWLRGPVLGKPGDSPSSATAIPQGEREFPLLYMSEPDLDELFSTSGATWIPSRAMWADGSSRFRMPPKFRELGFENVPPGVQWGCTPWL